MISRDLTIAEFATLHDRETSVIERMTRRLLGISRSRYTSPGFRLTPTQQVTLCTALEVDYATDPNDSVELVDAEITPAPAASPDPPTPIEELRFAALPHPVHVHSDVRAHAMDNGWQKKRLSLVLQQLGAHGETSGGFKGCQGDNRGWRRSPFGGTNGRQYYLWWARQGDRPVKHLSGEIGARDIVVRALRHHDDHSVLAAETFDAYEHIGVAQLFDGGLAEPPWTPGQRAFIDDDSPVRFVEGHPGAGKTSALWAAVESRTGQSVLYLTWSPALTTKARERFDAFAPEGTQVVCRDVLTLLGALTGRDVLRPTAADRHSTFEQAIGHVCVKQRRKWKNRTRDLYAEMRAYLIGRATPSAATTEATGLAHLDRPRYRALRFAALGPSLLDSTIETLELLARHDRLRACFPELAAASDAIAALIDDRLPDGYADFDRIVVDEAQDLTLLELTVIVELCRAIGRARGVSPSLLIAADEGQTVRPTGFEWGALSDLVTERLHPPERHALAENLRSPARIAAVVDRASTLYHHLSKGKRPSGRSPTTGRDRANAELYAVESSADDAVELIRDLDDQPGVAVLSCHDEPIPWLPTTLRDMVLTPAEAKGLEYQSVVVIDPGAFLVGFVGLSERTSLGSEGSAVRTRVDQLRVALSRATTSLTFLDVAANDMARDQSARLLGDGAPLDVDELRDVLAEHASSIDERVDAQLAEAHAVLDDMPRRAWRRALRAVRSLGNPSLPEGVSSPARREATHRTLLTVAAHILTTAPVAPPIGLDAVREAVKRSLTSLDAPLEAEAFDLLDAWSRRRAESPVDFLSAVCRLEVSVEWVRRPLAACAQSLLRGLESACRQPEQAAAFAGDVERWLSSVGVLGDRAVRADELRRSAVETLLDAGRVDDARSVLDAMASPAPLLEARLEETAGQYARAAEAYRRAGAVRDAVRCLRTLGAWESALSLAPPDSMEHADLSWFAELADVMGRRPAGQGGRLTPGEQRLLQELVGDLTSTLSPRESGPHH